MKNFPETLAPLLWLAELRAKREADGHFTLMRFTTGWKCFLGTPDLDTGEGRGFVQKVPLHPTAEAAITHFLMEGVKRKNKNQHKESCPLES